MQGNSTDFLGQIACRKCGNFKPLAEFAIYNNGRGEQRRQACRSCRNTYQRRVRENNGKAPPIPPAQEKRCACCKLMLPFSEFSPNGISSRTGKQYWAGRCKKCSCAQQKSLRANSPKVRKSIRARQRKRDYGITQEAYDGMVASQHGACAICGTTDFPIDRRSGRKRQLEVDHCHKTGNVRALLCHRCNNGLGCFRDNPNLLQVAISYLTLYNDAT